mmetsp:Transcript_10904/g.36219  ORF Transcript_10904/g.36219 Transcript_10904/m.36219 type:complete len:200 (+) Transcript_10904:220-819(+)
MTTFPSHSHRSRHRPRIPCDDAPICATCTNLRNMRQRPSLRLDVPSMYARRTPCTPSTYPLRTVLPQCLVGRPLVPLRVLLIMIGVVLNRSTQERGWSFASSKKMGARVEGPAGAGGRAGAGEPGDGRAAHGDGEEESRRARARERERGEVRRVSRRASESVIKRRSRGDQAGWADGRASSFVAVVADASPVPVLGSER